MGGLDIKQDDSAVRVVYDLVVQAYSRVEPDCEPYQ
jgi:hypothetical protein